MVPSDSPLAATLRSGLTASVMGVPSSRNSVTLPPASVRSTNSAPFPAATSSSRPRQASCDSGRPCPVSTSCCAPAASNTSTSRPEMNANRCPSLRKLKAVGQCSALCAMRPCSSLRCIRVPATVFHSRTVPSCPALISVEPPARAAPGCQSTAMHTGRVRAELRLRAAVDIDAGSICLHRHRRPACANPVTRPGPWESHRRGSTGPGTRAAAGVMRCRRKSPPGIRRDPACGR